MATLSEFLVQHTWPQIKNLAIKLAGEKGLTWDTHLLSLTKLIANQPARVPGSKNFVSLEEGLANWLDKYKKGVVNRGSHNMARPTRTKPDPIVAQLYRSLHSALTEGELEEASKSHARNMAIENIVGSLLEDYIAHKLEPFGWVAAWGSTVHAVDFYNPGTGMLLQVKNRSNSENSSSMAIRRGTDIQKWHRIDAYTGRTHWDKLEDITGVKGFSEEEFFSFATSIMISSDPGPILEAA